MHKNKERKNECQNEVTVVNSVRRSTESNRLLEEPAINILNREMDDNLLQESIKSSLESNVKSISKRIKSVDHLEHNETTSTTNKQSSTRTYDIIWRTSPLIWDLTQMFTTM
ncbi:hypothetical protein NPIL_660651 [Nephila pilipes]|uniref:Uncharacterized protein n=1 Tax=Nephila pilipes TaxID=299642 RepID=A0A8X6NET8_NEPPI|nr:hypothetical protein NPIL_660651 [Nephila pilipes]